ncbi:hypothetical protein [Cryptosporangium phraense]|uniref:Uncharacterized protein n=1 Tax=Cryptosporangium phraense TaxID=2593070 RepID=A0A545ANV5_9ACTN|nr:hypothetical protein [Cryptosporangium phraense]TQS42963.1 hypothetical protein FL583_21210 [Cryptosporangium phraense]
MIAYLLSVLLAAGLGGTGRASRTHGRQLAWSLAGVGAGVVAVGLFIRTADAGTSVSLLLLLTVLLGYPSWAAAHWLREPAAVPHWTAALAAGVGLLLVEGHVLAVALGSGWGVAFAALAGFAVLAPATIAWTIVGALWLQRRVAVRGRHVAGAGRKVDVNTIMSS